MADKSVPQFTEIFDIEDTDIYHVVRGGVDKRISGANIKANALPYKVYTALLSQSGDGTDTQTSGTLVVGKRYAITTFVSGDNFSNVAKVVSGTINTTGCEFIATGTTPTNYSHGSTLTDTSAPVATVLQNTIGDIVWSRVDTGIYAGTLTGAFTEYKTFCSRVILVDSQNLGLLGGNDVDSVEILTRISNVLSDDVLNIREIEIRVYP